MFYRKLICTENVLILNITEQYCTVKHVAKTEVSGNGQYECVINVILYIPHVYNMVKDYWEMN